MANPLCHFELMSSDPSKCKDFYRSIFNWEFDEESMPGYSVIKILRTSDIMPRGVFFTDQNINPTFHLHAKP